MSNSLGVIGNLFAVMILSVVIFFIIYFFLPSVSYKCFGVAYNETEIMENALINQIETSSELSDEEKKESISILSSPTGSFLVKSLLPNLNKENVDKVVSFLNTEEGMTFIENANSFVTSGKGSVEEYLKEKGEKSPLNLND